MRRIRHHRMRLAGLDGQLADKLTLEGQTEIVNVYLEFPPDGINRLNRDMALLLVQLTQRWCDDKFIAALTSGKT